MANDAEWKLFLDSYRHRDLSPEGRKRVDITVFTEHGGLEAVRYEIDCVWQFRAGICKSLMFLQRPKSLFGTLVLMIERRNEVNIDVFLNLSTSRKPIKIAHSRMQDSILGTDFNYEDLRHWRPIADFTPIEAPVDQSGERFTLRRLIGDTSRMVEITSNSVGEISRYCELDGQKYRRDFVVTDWHPELVLPSEIIATRDGRYSSRMKLVDHAFSFSPTIDVFDPERIFLTPSDRVAEIIGGRL